MKWKKETNLTSTVTGTDSTGTAQAEEKQSNQEETEEVKNKD